MSSIKYENQILNAIETVVNNAVEKAGYDKTIKAQIIEKTNDSIGEYKVRYQDSVFFAYSNDININYVKNSLVYILVPNNDMRQIKTIIGPVEKTDLEYEEVLEAEDYYDIIGTNILNNDNEFGLCSYNGSTNIVLFDKENNINLVNFDEQTFKTYLTNKYNILCGGWFKIILDDIQKNRGNYGISFDMQFKDPLDETHILTKTYSIDVNNMEGNPYNFKNFTRQASIFNIDTENYIGLEKIVFFAKDFPKIESGHVNDIFLKTPILYVAEEIPEAILNGYSVKINTDKNYFNEEDSDDTVISLHAIVKRKGKDLSDTKNIQYLWFKENAEVYPAMPGFNSYGGSGWECLNEFNILDDSDPTNIQKEYITNKTTLEILKSQCQALDNNYKVVVLIGENSNVENSITIKNYDYEYNLSISSDEGTKFYYGNGTPTLTLLVNGHENNDFTYKWISIDENNISTILEDTIEDNAIYNAAVENYNTLKAAVDSETVLPNAVEEQLNNYLETINSFDTKQRVEGNKIYKIQINEVPTYIIYKCSVYDGNNLIGTSSIKLNNYPRIEGEYFLNIENGTQTFNYDSAGISPASITLEHPMALPPLSFTIVDGKGNLLPDRIIDLCDVEWIYDEGNSLINVDSYDNRNLYYSLAEIYNISKINTSNITLKVTYQDLKLQAQTNFTFIKDGEPGTNGTDVICKIVPYTENENFSDYPVLYYNNSGDWALNFVPISNYRWFKVQLWKDNNLLWEGTNSKKRDNVIVKWSMLGNKYSNNVTDKSHINIVENSLLDDEYFNYSFYFNNVDSQLSNNQNVADILKVEITYKDKKYYSTLPIITVKTEDWTNYQYSLARHSGFRYVTYTADGCYPQYENTNPFTIKVWEKINDYLEDISNLAVNENYKLNYVWEICGSDYYIGNNENIASWHSDLKLIEKGIISNQGFYVPVEEFDGKNVSISLKITISQNGNVIGIMNIPIHFYLNRYGISTLNDWDGNHIEINENNDTILAPQVGAGRKEADNSFTGVLMGEVLESGQKDSQYGLYGYYQGDRTIELNAQNGSAKFGKVGAGQIILDPTDNTAKLKSGNYVAPVLDSDGNVVTPGQGLEIDLTDPHIIFGSGKFRVDNDGSVHATEYTTISDLEGGAYTIPQSSVENLSTFINTTNTSIENLQDQIDGNITTWFYAYVPTLNNEPASTWTTTTDKDNHLGDLFYDTSTGYCYRFMKNGDIYSWQQLSDSDIAAALAAAQAAQDTADHKRRVFYSTPTPPYDLGDLWVQGENGDILRCATAKTTNQSYALADWVLASKYTDDAVANAVQQNLDNLVIGARNYLLKSDTEISWNRTNSNVFQNVPFSPLLKELPDSTEFTISFLAKCNEAAEGLKIDFYLRNNSNSMSTLYEMDTLTTEYKKYVHIIKVDSGKHLADVAMCRFRLGAGSGIAYIKEYKLEAGNRATAWSPAPEDNIQSLDVEYYLSTSTDSPTGGSWSVTAPEWEDGKYMWSRQKITYGNGTVVYSNQTCIAGATGQNGYTVLLTNESESIAATTTAAIATTFSTNVLGFKGAIAKNTTVGTISNLPTGISASINNNGSTNTSITFTVTNQLTTKNGTIIIPVTIDGISFNKILSYSLSMTGAKGDSITISTKSIQYCLNDNGVTIPTSGWENNIPNPLTKGKYLWTKTYVKYSDNTETTSYSVSYVATDGNAGRGIISTEVKYVADTQGVNPPNEGASWSNNPPSGDTKGKYIWTRTRITYTDGQNPTTSYSVAYKGTDGSSITITSQVIEYAEGTSGTSHDNLTWQTTIPAVADEHYLWTRTTVNYSDNTTTVSYSVSYQSKDGEDATQYYTHVMYAEDASGTGISANPSGKSYIGIKVDTTQTASTTPGDYTWSKFVGENGTSGTDGFSLWTTTAAPTSSVYTRNQLTGPTALQTPRVGEIIIRSNRYQYTITAVSGNNITVGSVVDLKGSSGTSATNIVCGNEAQVIACNSDGTVTSATTITIPFAGYVGSSRKACSVTYSTLPNGITLTSNTAATTSADGSLVLAVAKDATLGNIDTGVITLTFSCNSLTFTKTFAWSKSKAGATGATGENGSGIKYFGTRSWTDTEITNTYKIGYSSTWSNDLHIETKIGDLLLLYVTNSTYGTKCDYILEVTTGSTTSTTPTAKVIAITKDGDAPVVNIIPSAQVFKSTEGAAGTFTPEYIYLYPVLKNCAYSKWQYSTDGTTWTNVSSGSHGLTIGTYDTMANTLRISRDSDLYTSSITSISFKCLSGLSTAYDVISIVKIYDVTDIEVGGTNLIYNSGEFDNEMTYWAKNGGTTLEIATVDNYRVLHALGSIKQDPAKVIYHLNWGTSYVYHAYVKFSIGGTMTSSTPLASWIYKTNNYNDIGASNDAATINNFYVDTPGNKTILANTWHHIVIYFSTITKPNNYQYVNMLPFFDGSPFITNNSGSDYYIRWIKLEKGTLFTDWSPAPEDANTIIDSIAAAISEGVVRIADGNILIADNASAPTHIIIMNHNGIAFFNAQQAWPSLQEIETASATSAWSIAGDLNMNNLKGGTLKLGNASNTNGVIEVYNGNGVLVNKIDKDGLQLKVGSAFENVGTIVDNIGEAYSHITSLTDTNDSEIIDFDMEGYTDQLYNEWDEPYALQSIGYTNLFNKGITMIQSGAFKTEINNGARLTATVAGNWTYAYVQLGGSELLGKTITISSTFVTNASNQGCIALFFANSSNVAHTSIDSSLRGSGFKTVTIKIPSSFPSGADRINLLLYANGNGTGTVGCYTEYHDLIITEGIAKGYVPYGKYGIEIWSLGKNLFNKNDIVEGKLNSSGEVISDDSYVTSNYIPIIGNRGNLTISNNSGNNEYICLYDMDFGLSNAINIGSSTTKTVNIDNLCHYLRVTVNKTKLNEYQVQYGSSSSSYQEHQSSQITYIMDEPLRSINEVADTIYVDNGAVYLERKIGSTIWNGTEEWFQYEEGIFDTLENKKRIPASGDDGYILTSSLKQWSDTSGVPWMENSVGEVAENKYIYVNYGFMSLEEWKSTLANSNIEVLYLLEKPIITRISLELPKTYKSETSITPTTKLVQGIYHLKYIKGNILSDYIEDRLSRTQTEFSVTADEISSKVGRGDVVSSINQSAEQITINADKISLAGKTINLTSDNIAINSTNFKVTKEGNVTANNLALTGGSVSGVNINLTGSNYQDVKFQISSTDSGNSYSTKISPAELVSKETSPNDPNYSGIGNSNQTWEALTTYSTLAYFNVFSKDCSLSDGVYKTSFGGSCDYSGNVSFSIYARRSNYNEAGVRSYIYSGWTNSPTVGIALFTTDSSSPQTEVTTAKVKAPVIQQTSIAESKKDIELFNKSALSLINNSDIYTYHLKTEEETNKKHIGLVIGDNYKCCDEVIAEDKQSVVLYTISSLSWKAIQELTKEIEKLKKEIKGE